MTHRVVCELLGPPAAGKSRLAGRLRTLGHGVIEEQLQQHLAALGPPPTTMGQALERQRTLVDLVVDAVAAATRPPTVVDVGVVSALVFATSRLPAELVSELLDHAVERTQGAGLRVASTCLVHAAEEVLRDRAGTDTRRRSSLEENLQLTPHVEASVAALRSAAPDSVLLVPTDGDVDASAISQWISSRADSPTNLVEVLRDLHRSGRLPGRG